MAVSFCQVAVDAHDLPSPARFWCQVLDRHVLFETEHEIVIGGRSARPVRQVLRTGR